MSLSCASLPYMASYAAMSSDDCFPENLTTAFKAFPLSVSFSCWRANLVQRTHACYLAFPFPNTPFSVLASAADSGFPEDYVNFLGTSKLSRRSKCLGCWRYPNLCPTQSSPQCLLTSVLLATLPQKDGWTHLDPTYCTGCRYSMPLRTDRCDIEAVSETAKKRYPTS